MKLFNFLSNLLYNYLQTISEDQAKRFAKFRERKHRVEKDVVRLLDLFGVSNLSVHVTMFLLFFLLDAFLVLNGVCCSCEGCKVLVTL